MSAIDEVLLLLTDGNWHKLKEITQKITSSEDKTEKIVSFLKEYDFVKLSKDTKEVKIQHTILEFIEQIQILEKKAL